MEPGSNELAVMAERFAVEAMVSGDEMGPVSTELTACEELGLVERDSFMSPAFLQRLSNLAFSFPSAAATWGVSCSGGQSLNA